MNNLNYEDNLGLVFSNDIVDHCVIGEYINGANCSKCDKGLYVLKHK